MAQLQNFNTDLDVIQKHGDNPNTDNGLTAAALRAEFDKSGNLIKAWINTYLVPAFNDLDNGALSKDELTQAVNKALEQAKKSGQFDGVSPTVTITEISVGHLVTITDAEGEKSFIVADGKEGDPGKNGISPTVSVSPITGGHRVTVTDAEGEKSFDVTNGKDGAGGVISVNGMNGNVTLPVPILGTCSTGASDATKVVAITGASGDTTVIVSGTVLRVKFSNANTASGIKLSVPGVSNQYPVIDSSMEGVVAPNAIGNRIHTFVFTSGAWVLLDPANASGTVDLDTTLSVSGKAADAKAAGDALAGKLNANQGASNAGKILGIVKGGVVTPVDVPEAGTVDLDTTLSVSGKAADAKATGDALADKLSKSGGTMTGNIIMGGNTISGAGSVDSTHYFIGDASDISEYANNFDGTYGGNPLCVSTDQGGYNLIVGGGKIGGLTGTPSNNDDASNKKYVDDVSAGKLSVNQGAGNAGKILGIGSDGVVKPVAAVKVDTTLSVSGKAADAKAAGDALAGKLNANQGTGNAGKFLGIGSDGAVAPVAAPAGGGSGESDWRLIKDITVESDVKSVSVNSDYNGAGFSCREIYILSNAVNASGQTSATYLKLDFNGKGKYDGNNNQSPYVTFGKTGESGRNWFWVKSINPLIVFHGKWVTQGTTQEKNVYCIQQHINDAVPNPFAEGEKIESIGISGGLSSSYIASGSRILIYGR